MDLNINFEVLRRVGLAPARIFTLRPVRHCNHSPCRKGQRLLPDLSPQPLRYTALEILRLCCDFTSQQDWSPSFSSPPVCDGTAYLRRAGGQAVPGERHGSRARHMARCAENVCMLSRG